MPVTSVRPDGQPAPTKHLNQIELARRWQLSPRTLERWRWLQQGPAYMRVGGTIRYRLEDIEAFEKVHLRQPPGGGAVTRRDRSRAVPTRAAGAKGISGNRD